MHQADLRHEKKSLQEKLEYIYTLGGAKTVKLGFRPPYLKLLELLGNPHLYLPPTIHVAGTNGKGSIIAIMRAILEAAGYRAHVYTSPHLHQFNERVVLAGTQISDEYLEQLLDQSLGLIDPNDPLSFFEITTALAFKAFAEAPADILLLEVGLGGRLDCTNVIERPLASVITPIAFDHMEFLGNTLEKIAGEKAGIIKKNCFVITAKQSSAEIDHVFHNKAQELDALLITDWNAEKIDEEQWRFCYQGQDNVYALPNLQGEHQIQNAGTALASLKVIADGFPVSDENIRKGLQNIQWHGRLQKLFDNGESEIWFDGGHNESAGLALAEWMKEKQKIDTRPFHLIVGMKADKEADKFLAPLLPLVEDVTIVPVKGVQKCLSQNMLQVPNPKIKNSESLEILLQDNKKTRTVKIIAGSLYLFEKACSISK